MNRQSTRWGVLAIAVGVALAGSVMATTAAPANYEDLGFGDQGRVITHFGATSTDLARAVAVDDAGRMVVAGGSNGNFALARYSPDGSPDTGFDGDGRLTTDFGQDDQAVAVVIQSDGRIVVAGSTTSLQPPFTKQFAVARYNPDGGLDLGFGPPPGGKVTIGFPNPALAHGLAIDGAGRIVVAGDTGAAAPMDLALARLDAAGSPDPSFDGDGKLTTNLGGDDRGNAVAIQANGQIVVAGYSTARGTADFAVVRYGTNGALDTTFDGDGIVLTDIEGRGGVDHGNALVIQPDQRIVVAGNTGAYGDPDFAALRYHTGGGLDTSFDGDGLVVVAWSPDDRVYGVSLTPDGAIVLAGRTGPAATSDFAVFQLRPDGRLDTGFGNGGGAITDFGQNDYGYGVAVQSDGKPIVAGETNVNGTRDFALVRYLEATPPIDTLTPGTTPTSTTPAPTTATLTSTPSGTRPAATTVTPTSTPTGTDPVPTTATLTGTPSGTRPVATTVTPRATATGTDPAPTTATPATTPTRPTPTGTGPVPTALTPTRTPTGASPTPCAPLSDVGLVAPAGNVAEGQLLREVLDLHARAWRQATGHTLTYQVHVYDGGETYSQWLGERLSEGFARPGFCAARYVAVVSDNELSKNVQHFENLRPDFFNLAPESPRGAGPRFIESEFLSYAWQQVLFGSAPYALPWLRDACSESYGNLALVKGTASDTALSLLDFLVEEARQRVNYDAKDPASGARLAFPTLKQPYEIGWTGAGGTVSCRTVPPVDVPDPALVDEAIRQARITAARLKPVIEAVPYAILRYSHGPDTDNVVYDSPDGAGAGSFLASSAVALTVKAPLSGEQAAEYMATGGLIVGQISFYAPGGQAVTPTAVPTRQPVPTVRPGSATLYLSGVLKHASFLDPLPGSDPPYKAYAVMWRLESGAPRAWLVRPDGSLVDASDVARDLGLAAGDIEFEAVVPSGEARLGADVWAETGSKKNCWGIDGLEWCMKKKK